MTRARQTRARFGKRFGVFTTGVCACALLCGPARAVHAETRLDFALELDAPATAHCISAAQLRSTIEQRIGSLVFLDDPNPARQIHVKIAERPATGGYAAEISMRDERGEVVGERQMDAQPGVCSELDEALVVVISTLIGIADEAARTAATKAEEIQQQSDNKASEPPPSAHTQDAVPAAASGSLPSTTHQAQPARATPLLASLSASGRADLGLLPALAPGATLALGLDVDAWAFVVGVTFLPQASQDLGRGAAANFMGALGSASLCVQAASFGGAGATRVAFCAGAEAGALAVSTLGLYARATDALEPLVRGVVGPQLRVGFSRHIGLLGSLAAAVPFYFPRYYYFDEAGARRYYHAVGLGISAQLGMYWRFSS